MKKPIGTHDDTITGCRSSSARIGDVIGPRPFSIFENAVQQKILHAIFTVILIRNATRPYDMHRFIWPNCDIGEPRGRGGSRDLDWPRPSAGLRPNVS